MPYTFGQTWFYFIFFLPGLVTFFFGHHLLEPLWSIGIEEVFYLIWAPIFKIGKHKILPILLSIIALKIMLMLMAQFWIKDALFVYMVNIFSFEAMSIGGLGAYFIFHRKNSLSEMLLYKLPVQLIIYSLLIIYLIFHSNIDHPVWNFIFKTPILSGLFVDFLFLYLIVGVSLIDNNIFKFRNKLLSYLGEISYGIYMYHLIIIFAIIQFLKKYLIGLDPVLSTLLFYSIVIVSVISVASVSKIVFENYFLNLKKKVDKN